MLHSLLRGRRAARGVALIAFVGAAVLPLWGQSQSSPELPMPPRLKIPTDPAHVLQVERVVDGRTLSVTATDGVAEVRLVGVRLPQPAMEREAAKQFLEQLVIGESIVLDPAPTSSGAADPPYVLAYRLPEGTLINLELVRQGYARTLKNPPFDAYDDFRVYERLAREAKKGIWAPRGAKPSRRPPKIVAPHGEGEAVEPGDREPAATGVIVYVTRSGSKYHREGCPHLTKTQRPIPLAEAVRRYEPCKRCKPPRLPQRHDPGDDDD